MPHLLQSPNVTCKHKMTLRYLYILLYFLTACNSHPDDTKTNVIFGQKVSYKPTDLAVFCTRAIKTLDNEIHGVSFIDSKGKSISKDTLKFFLYRLSKYDVTDNGKYETYLKTCRNVDFLTWKAATHKMVVTRIEKVSFGIDIPLNDGGKNEIKVTDFDIYSVDTPNHLAIRIIDDYDLEYLIIDDNKYSRFAESIPVGLDIAIAKLDSAKKNACR